MPEADPARAVPVGADVVLANDRPWVLLGGLNVLESRDLAFSVAEALCRTTEALGIPFVFKASFDKANRSAATSFRGPGLDAGLRLLEAVKQRFDVPIVTDIHAPEQAAPVAEVADLIQIPAFLCRQTDLIEAACRTGRPLHLKKMQMMAPEEAGNLVAKCAAFGQEQVVLCERGTLFGYGTLVVDPLAFPKMKALGVPVTFDVTHALQLPGALGTATGGRREYTETLARAGLAQGLAGLFLECHPNPDQARCDGPCALPLARVPALLRRLQALDHFVKETLDAAS